MANRHQRRKAALRKQEDKLIALATAERSRQIAETVKANKSAPIERNYYSNRSTIDDVKVNTYIGFREPRASGGMGKRGVTALQAKGANFTRADGLNADSAALAGQHLSGRAIREQAEKIALDKAARLRAQ